MSESRNRRTSWGVTAIALVLAAHYWGWGGEYARSDVRELREAVARVTVTADSLRLVRDSLLVRGDSLEVDPYVIERVARERHAFIRPGERLYLFVEGAEPLEPAGADESEP